MLVAFEKGFRLSKQFLRKAEGNLQGSFSVQSRRRRFPSIIRPEVLYGVRQCNVMGTVDYPFLQERSLGRRFDFDFYDLVS